MTISLELSELRQELAPLKARQRIERAYEIFGEDLILSTSFGLTAGVMLKLATDVYPDIRVLTVRHGYESPRTLEIADHFVQQLNLNLKVYQAPQLLIPDDDSPEFEEFKHNVKVEPFRQALETEQPRAWLSGVMRDETKERRTFDYVMPKNGTLAVYPILDWTQIHAEEYCLAHALPLNTTYYDPSKGSEQNKECGLHLGDIGTSWTSSGL